MNTHTNNLSTLFLVAAALAATFAPPQALGHAAPDQPLPPLINVEGPLEYKQTGPCPGPFCFPPSYLRLSADDPNPDGSGLPLTIAFEQLPPPQLAVIYQVEADNETLGEPITSIGTVITNPDHWVAFKPGDFVDAPVSFRYNAVNAFDLEAHAIITMTAIPTNFPPVALEKGHVCHAHYAGHACINIVGFFDVNNDPLTIVVTEVPQIGELYNSSVAPQNLVKPGMAFTSPTFYYVSPIEPVPSWCPGHLLAEDEWSFYVTDGEYDSNIALQTVKTYNIPFPPDFSPFPTKVEVLQHEEYVDIWLTVTPMPCSEPELHTLLMTKIPDKGLTQFALPNDGVNYIYIDITQLSPNGFQLPQFYDYVDTGLPTWHVRYWPKNTEPTEPGDPSMQFEFQIGDWWNQWTAPDVDVTILPASCKEDFVPGDCCHASCPASWCEGNVCEDFCDPLDGASLHLDGNGRYVELGPFAAFMDVVNSGTIEAWFRTDHIDSTMSLIRTSSGAGLTAQDLHVRFNDSAGTYAPEHVTVRRQRGAFLTSNSRTKVYHVPEAFDNQWHHLAWAFDAQIDLMELYIDGVLREPVIVQKTSQTSGPTFVPTGEPVVLGAASINGAKQDFFVGQIDEVRFWGVPRHPDAIAADMHGVVKPDAPNLHSYWRLDEGAGALAANIALAPLAPAYATLVDYPSWVATITCDDDVPPPTCPADLTNSGTVGVPDLLALLGAWGPCSENEPCPADLTNSDSVGVPDLLALLGAWGPCP